MLQNKNILSITYLTLVLALSACTNNIENASNSNSNNAQSNNNIEVLEQQLIQESAKDTKKHQYEDIWSRIINGFKLQPANERHLTSIFNSHIVEPNHLEKISSYAQPYIYYVVQELEKRNMPTELALLPMVESSYNPFSLSSSGAAGLWQFMPSTGKIFNLKQSAYYDGRRDILASTKAALDYFQYLYNQFQDWELAIAAYNGGEGRIRRAVKKNQLENLKTDIWSLEDISAETKKYLPKLLAYKQIILEPDRFNIKLTHIPNYPYFKTVETHNATSITQVAQSFGVHESELMRLNAGHKQHILKEKVPLLIPLYANHNMAAQQTDKYSMHVVASGENLYTIALIYNTHIGNIVSFNDLADRNLRTGQILRIPESSIQQHSYQVRTGDTLYSIANKHGIPIEKLKTLNNIQQNSITTGQLLLVND